MSTLPAKQTTRKSIAYILLNKRYWLFHFLFVILISVAGLFYLGGVTYNAAPPLADFISADGTVIISQQKIDEGQNVFLRRGLMTYGSFWGDGAERGPDFSADALHQITLSMQSFYEDRIGKQALIQYDKDAISLRVRRELHANGWNEKSSQITINEAQAYAFEKLEEHYMRTFADPNYSDFIHLGHVLSGKDIHALSAFLFWGAWVASADRPGENYSYTHNWPYDPVAGNTPTVENYTWSIISVFALFLGIGIVLYVYGQMKVLFPEPFTDASTNHGKLLTTSDLEDSRVRSTQRSTYKFFALAIIAFGLQVLAGIMGATDFVRPIGNTVPFSVVRSYHTMFQIFWFFMCWVGYTIFFLPRFSAVPRGQKILIDLLFALCLSVAIGALIGIYFGQKGILTGDTAYWLGSQGWEYMELGRLFQIILLIAFSLWIFIIYRAVKPWLTKKNLWSVPAWLLYGSGIMVFFLFFGLLVTPKTNFAVADFWRWMVVHMWVEVTFEVFTTVIVAYIMVQMNFITRTMAERVIFLAVLMFLFTATIGIAHNFYWIAKPTGVIALGSVFSTLQVVPLLLLTLDAWQIRQKGRGAAMSLSQGRQKILMDEVWLFILAVNFWNIFGAGILGSLINLPIVNYFEHATYLTTNHAHGAMFGVKGNIALGGLLFCCQHLFPRTRWNAQLVRTAFWSLNIGVAIMMFLDMFPIGIYQLLAVLEHGFWYGRSPAIIASKLFVSLTYLRLLGAAVFVCGGLLPLMWFVLSRGYNLLPETNEKDIEQPISQEEWSSQNKA